MGYLLNRNEWKKRKEKKAEGNTDLLYICRFVAEVSCHSFFSLVSGLCREYFLLIFHLFFLMLALFLF